jgi:hypothetical protein
MVRTIKLFQMLLILSGIIFGSLSSASEYQGYCSDSSVIPNDSTVNGGGGGSHPWPWNLAVTFDLKDVQGIWKVQKGGKAYFFGFRRVSETRLSIKQFDSNLCTVIASGPGFQKDGIEKTVVAQLNNTVTGEVYRMAIYAFNEEDSPEPPLTSRVGVPTPVMVARITSLNTSEREFAVQMVRISDRLEFKCVGHDKILNF